MCFCCEIGLWTWYENICNLHQSRSFSFTLGLQLYFCFLRPAITVSDMSFTNIAFVVLCLAHCCLAAPLTCDNVVQLTIQTELPHWYGAWNLVAWSVRVLRTYVPLVGSDSFTLHYNNATFLATQRVGDQCLTTHYNITMEGPHFTTRRGFVTVNGTIFSSSNSCPDCILALFTMDAPYFTIENLCLFSRRRELNPEELQDLKSLKPCLKFTDHTVIDSSKERCPPPDDFYPSENKNWE